MTHTRHLDDEALITIIANGAAAPGAASHIDRCSSCAGELDAWRRISDLAIMSVDSVPPAGEELAERVLDPRQGPEERRAGRSARRPTLPHPERNRRVRWLIPVPLAVAAIVLLVVTLGSGSTAPSDALVLDTIRNSPAVAATLTHHFTSETVLRAPQGYVAIEYHDHGADSPRNNAFEITSTEIEPDGPSIDPTTIVSDGTLVYLPCEAGWQSIGEKPCLAYPAQGGTPGSLADLRTAHGPVTRLGERRIDGVETTGYGVAASVRAIVDTLVPSERSLYQYDSATVSDVHLKVWFDSRGLARELDVTWLERQSNLPARLHASEREQITYTKAPLHLSVPARNTVTVAPNVTTAINLENQYQNEVSACFHAGCNG